MVQVRLRIAQCLDTYARSCDDAAVSLGASAALLAFVVVGALVKADLAPKAKIARILAARLRK